MAVIMPTKPTLSHVSHTQISMFERCQLQWFLKYVKGIVKPPTIPMLAGQCYHKALALNFKQKRYTGEDLPVSDVLDCYNAAFEAALTQEDTSAAAYKSQVSNLLEYYYQNFVINKMDPLLVEHELRVDIPDSEKIFVGVIDLQLTDGTMIDFKVSSRRFPDSEITENKQASAYAMLSGMDIDFEFHIGLRANKNPSFQILKLKRTRADVDKYKDYVVDVIGKMKKLEDGDALPSVCTGFCNEKICQYYQECLDWKYGLAYEANYGT